MKKETTLLGEIDSFASQLHELEDSDQRQLHSDEYSRLLKLRTRLYAEEGGLAEELAIWEVADPKQALSKLKHRVETQSKELKRGDEVSKELRDQIAVLKTQLTEFHDELKERKVESGSDRDKYEKLRQRDDEMSLFISQFEATHGSTAQDQMQAQDAIVALLEHISQGLEQQKSMPSQQGLREMRDEASFKERQLESSQETTRRLVQERAQREKEMAKIDTLDEKIQIELVSLEQKMEVMRSDMVEFDNIEGLRQRAAAAISALSRLLKEYQGRRESVKSQVTHLTSRYEALKGKIQSSDAAKALSALESKLRTYGQTIFHLQEYVETKSRETDSKSVRVSCMALVGRLNSRSKTSNI
mmetsp:Transcript_36578/g.113167  ORF Transcript_36578/g.113167 Transcript_36578/m.113167 type:complete len:359 (-) Transcript_36578:207-1283(-)